MPKAHQRHGGMTPEYLITRAGRVGYRVAGLAKRLMRDRGSCAAINPRSRKLTNSPLMVPTFFHLV